MAVEVALEVAMVEEADILLWLMEEAVEVHESLGRETWVGGAHFILMLATKFIIMGSVR